MKQINGRIGYTTGLIYKDSYYFENRSLSLRNNSRRTKPARIRCEPRCIFGICWRSEFSPIEFLKGVAERLTRAMCCGSVSRRRPLNKGLSTSVGKSKLTAASSVDYYRAAAVEDCIEFIHTSFSRSNSLTAAPTPSRDEFMHAFLRNFESQNV
ncbi:hypothetical protein Ahy_A01g004440 isoform K [Arachis hypogaea]|uniref:Josephin-like protein n=1 Tax=Arachis hypogaea TaxID=3818 RepID=A0A445EW38_ARAHY|nr:hypothetical protein Ahy_A01g004440 isoform K [Arachis hypogaea]